MSLPEPPSGAIRAMTKTTVSEPAGHPSDVVDDPLTEVLRSGAQRLLVQAIEAEAEAFWALMAGWKLEDGRARFVRHGPIIPNLGPSAVSRPASAPCPYSAPRSVTAARIPERYGGGTRQRSAFSLGDPAAMGAPLAEP